MSSRAEKDTATSERLPPKTVYETIQHEGEKELQRPASSLWWSGFVAGLAISASLVAQGTLHEVLPEGGWKQPVEYLGYCIGFVIVILGRLQLFTEDTITPVLPIMADFSSAALLKMLRLWSIVLVANFAGTFTAALFADIVRFASPEQLAAFYEISRTAVLGKTALEVFVQAIPAGFYVATLVWMLPSSKGFELWVIIIMTYLIAIGGFAHVIVGSMEVFLLLLDGQVSIAYGIGTYLLPALAGNIVGGTVLFSLLAYAQVREEIE